MGGSSKQTIGYQYGLGLHVGVCHGPVDEVQALLAGDREAWTGSVTTTNSVQVNKPDLFGGEKKEGGLIGQLDIEMGGPTQGQNSYLVSKIGSSIPAFRGILGLVWRGGFLSAMTPYIKPWAIRVKRIRKGWSNDVVWNTSRAEITGDMNPAHIIYQCITDTSWGMGYSSAFVNDASFTAAADTLYTEGFGLSMIWNKQESIENFIKMVTDHIGAVVYVMPDTGQFALKLIRDDYDRNTLPQFGPSNVISADNYQRQAWGETINEITVKYRDRATNKDASITVQDLANINTQAQVVATTREYPGLPNAGLAQRVAMRELIAVSTPISRISLKINRTAWSLMPGSVFRLTWPAYDIDDIVYRVTEINKGSMQDGTITVECVEDVFSMPSNTYIGDQPPAWIDPISEPSPVTLRRLIEASYWDLSRTMSAADLDYMDPLSAYVATFGARPTSDAYSYRIHSKIGAADYAEHGTGYFSPTATLTGALTKEITSTFTYSDDLNVDLVVPGTWAVIDNEYIVVQSINTGTATITAARGVLDTVPEDHAAGARIWFGDDYNGFDETEYADGETVSVKMLTYTGLGTLDIDDATADTITVDQRHYRPYPPGNIKISSQISIDGESNPVYSYLIYPSAIVGETVTITWAHRDRETQTAYIVTQGESSIGPEAGVTYTIRIYNAQTGGTLIRTYSGLTGTSQAYTRTQAAADNGGTAPANVRLEIESVRDGVTSWQKHVIKTTWAAF